MNTFSCCKVFALKTTWVTPMPNRNAKRDTIWAPIYMDVPIVYKKMPQGNRENFLASLHGPPT